MCENVTKFLRKYLVVSKNPLTFALAFGEQRFATIKTSKSLMTKAKKCKNVENNLVVQKNQLTFAKFSANRGDITREH